MRSLTALEAPIIFLFVPPLCDRMEIEMKKTALLLTLAVLLSALVGCTNIPPEERPWSCSMSYEQTEYLRGQSGVIGVTIEDENGAIYSLSETKWLSASLIHTETEYKIELSVSEKSHEHISVDGEVYFDFTVPEDASNGKYYVQVEFDGYLEKLPARITVIGGDIYEKLTDTDLEFWIVEDVAGRDFSDHAINPGWFGATEYYGLGYAHEESSDDAEYVSYLVTAYPDYADGGEYVTRITVTDPEVNIMSGLTAASSADEWDAALTALGCTRDEGEAILDEGTEYKFSWSSEDGRLTFTLSKRYSGEVLWNVYAPVSNRDGIVY